MKDTEARVFDLNLFDFIETGVNDNYLIVTSINRTSNTGTFTWFKTLKDAQAWGPKLDDYKALAKGEGGG